MSGFHGKGRSTDGNVIGPFGFRSTVLNPLARMSQDRFPGMHIENAVTMCDSKDSFQDEREFLEVRRLPRLDPACGTLQVCNAGLGLAGMGPTDVLVNPNGFVCHRLNTIRQWNESRHSEGSSCPRLLRIKYFQTMIVVHEITGILNGTVGQMGVLVNPAAVYRFVVDVSKDTKTDPRDARVIALDRYRA